MPSTVSSLKYQVAGRVWKEAMCVVAVLADKIASSALGSYRLMGVQAMQWLGISYNLWSVSRHLQFHGVPLIPLPTGCFY